MRGSLRRIRQRLTSAKRTLGFLDKVLRPPLPLPEGISEERLYSFLSSCLLEDAPRREMENYCRGDYLRFVHTLGLVPQKEGRLLELGANPYFTTMLIKEFRNYEMKLSNYFSQEERTGTQKVFYKDLHGVDKVQVFEYEQFNIEEDPFPYPDEYFDVVLFCEIIEHLLNDPVAALLEIKRVLRPGGLLIITTPNVGRLENVARLIAGANIYDPYSGYGPYGRHNREYTRHELALLFDYSGFEPELVFSADVRPNEAANFFEVPAVERLVESRAEDLGQYLFTRSRNVRPAKNKRPAWLYRSYPPESLE